MDYELAHQHVCGVSLFLLREGRDGWRIFQIAATSRTDGCRAIVK
jgi:hypothetical protein